MFNLRERSGVQIQSFVANNIIFIRNQCEKMSWPSSRNLNPRPLIHELSPIANRPGLPPNSEIVYLLYLFRVLINQMLYSFIRNCEIKPCFKEVNEE